MTETIDLVMDATDQTGSALAVIRTALPTILAADQNDILGNLAAKVKAHKPDISTAKGRDEIRSLAAEIASSKMTLIKLGKSLTEGWRKSTKAVNEECNTIEEKMDALKVQVRQPLTDFENMEKNRVAAHQAAMDAICESSNYGLTETSAELALRLDYLKNYPPRDWQEFGMRAVGILGAEIDRTAGLLQAAQKREAEAAELVRLRAEQAERDRLAAIEAQRVREERIAADAAEAARKAAEHKAAAEVLEAERHARAAREAAAAAQARAAQAEADKVEAAAAAERAKEAAAAQAQRDMAAAVAAERKRLADQMDAAHERDVAAQAEADRRAANVAHQRKVNGEAMTGLLALGLTEEQGKAIITAIVRGAVPHVRLEY